MKWTGISFPFRISPASGGVQMASADDAGDITLLRQSITQILLTQIGERTIEKNFGCDIPKRVFDPLDDITQQALQYTMVKALTLWEPRIQVNSINFLEEVDSGKILMRIQYSVTRTGAQDLLMVPMV